LYSSTIGETGGMWSLGLTIYTITLAIVTMKLAIHTPRYTLYHIISLLLSLIVYVATIYFNSILPKWNLEWINIKTQSAFLFTSPSLWFFIILGPIAACLPDTTFQIFFNHKSPKDFHIMQEMEHGWQNNVYISHHQEYVDQISDFANEQIMEEEGINFIDDESLSSQTVFVNNLQEGGSIESDKTSLPKLDNLSKPNWKENIKNDQMISDKSHDPTLNKDDNIENIPTLDSKGRVKFNRIRKAFIHEISYFLDIYLLQKEKNQIHFDSQ
jgi:hypothetical protein